MRIQLFAARLALVALGAAALTAAAAIASVRVGHAPFSTGLTIMTGATALGLIALTCALFWLLSALKNNNGTAKRVGLVALIGSIALLWPPLHSAYLGLTSPAIHDATNNPEDPPQFVKLAAMRQPGMNAPAYDGGRQIRFRGQTNTANFMLHTYYEGLTHPKAYLLMTKGKLFWRAFEAAKRMGWHIVDYSEADGRIEATASSFWFGQTADIVIRVQEAGSIGARLDVRSANQSGTRDFGSNIVRLQEFLTELQQRR